MVDKEWEDNSEESKDVDFPWDYSWSLWLFAEACSNWRDKQYMATSSQDKEIR